MGNIIKSHQSCTEPLLCIYSTSEPTTTRGKPAAQQLSLAVTPTLLTAHAAHYHHVNSFRTIRAHADEARQSKANHESNARALLFSHRLSSIDPSPLDCAHRED